MSDRTCSVQGCERREAARGWCIMHYKRWWNTGNPDVGPAESIKPRGMCSVDDCDRPHQAHGYCDLHYRRVRREGEPGPSAPRFGEQHYNWKGDDAGYQAAHHRVWDQRGKAKDHVCVHCGEQAKDWAYDHTDPDAKLDSTGRAYSVDMNHYLPLCGSCHQRFDRAQRSMHGLHC